MRSVSADLVCVKLCSDTIHFTLQASDNASALALHCPGGRRGTPVSHHVHPGRVGTVEAHQGPRHPSGSRGKPGRRRISGSGEAERREAVDWAPAAEPLPPETRSRWEPGEHSWTRRW
jgi:hypothetical protein